MSSSQRRSHIKQPSAPLLGTWEARLGAFILVALAVAALGLITWPSLHFAVAPAGLWVLGVLWTLWKRPRLLWKRGRLWLGALFLVFAMAGAFTVYQDGWGGTLGRDIAGTSQIFGGIRTLLVVVVAVAVMEPRRAWRASRSTLLGLHEAGRRSAPVVARTATAVGHGARQVGIMLWSAVLAVVQAYRQYSLKRRAARSEQDAQALSGTQTLDEFPSSLETLPPGMDVEAPIEEALVDDAEFDTAEVEEAAGPVESGAWVIPPRDLLLHGEEAWVSEEESQDRARLIEETLADYGIEVTVEAIRPGPVVTQFGLVPGWVRRYRDVQERDAEGNPLRDEAGRLVKRRVEEKTRVKVDNILSREKDLALALAAHSIRFEAPVPGESFVGLEVPNLKATAVTLRSIVENPAFARIRSKGPLPLAMGKGSGGEPVVADLASMPHVLIAGSTGSGKSVCINAIITSLLLELSPERLRLLLVDPKRVELTPYQGLPHLLSPVLVEADEALPALRGLVAEMQSRYKQFEKVSARNIELYNGKMTDPASRLPYIVLIVDELADLMMTVPAEVEQSLCRLAQLGRATGIHIVLATQRPSVDVLTGLIKANFPSRISFAVSSQIDSRTILDGSGAEKLLGRGDMLFHPTDILKPKRMQGAYISDKEVNALVSHWKKQGGKVSVQEPPLLTATEEPASEGADSLVVQARDLALRHRRVSAPLLQRKLGVGYNRASGILEELEEMGIVGPGDPGKSRPVLLGPGVPAGGEDSAPW